MLIDALYCLDITSCYCPAAANGVRVHCCFELEVHGA